MATTKENQGQNIPPPVYYNAGDPQHTAVVISQPPVNAVYSQPPPSDHLGLSIVSVFCCLCCGLAAVFKSIKSRDFYHVGDYEQAKIHGQSAKSIALMAITAGIVLIIINVVVRVLQFYSDTQN